jgi:hypothetical protein
MLVMGQGKLILFQSGQPIFVFFSFFLSFSPATKEERDSGLWAEWAAKREEEKEKKKKIRERGNESR